MCSGKAVYEVKYNGSSLCKEHFIEFVEKRVKKELRDQIDLKRDNVRISVAISGGKDSSVTLYLLHKILSQRKNVKISAFTIDEGIKGYRDGGLKAAQVLCSELGIEHEVMSFKENFGHELDEIVKIDGGTTIPCSHCGPMRRQLMNKISMINNADYVALGINLDDYAQSILMNVAKGDAQRMARMAPHKNVQKDLIPRIVPLRKIPEKEVMLYALLQNIKFDGGTCPYYARAQRNKFRTILSDLEQEAPGTKHAIVNFLDKIRPTLTDQYPQVEMNKCKNCGAPTPGELCVVCSDIGNLKSVE